MSDRQETSVLLYWVLKNSRICHLISSKSLWRTLKVSKTASKYILIWIFCQHSETRFDQFCLASRISRTMLLPCLMLAAKKCKTSHKLCVFSHSSVTGLKLCLDSLGGFQHFWMNLIPSLMQNGINNASMLWLDENICTIWESEYNHVISRMQSLKINAVEQNESHTS